MKYLRILPLLALSFFVANCGSVNEAINDPGTSQAPVVEVFRVLDTTRFVFYDLAQQNLSSSPGQVMMLTRDWLKTRPDVQDVYTFDSLNVDIELKSGMHAIYSINVAGPDGQSLTRGGDPRKTPPAMPLATNTITNKKVMIFAPFVGKGLDDLYSEAEIDKLANSLRNSDQHLQVDVVDGKLSDVDRFGDYGLVLIETHGLPIGFYSGHELHGLSTLYDTNETGIKLTVNSQLGFDAYGYIKNGSFYFAYQGNLAGIINWQMFLEKPDHASPSYYRLVIASRYINGLSPMPKTIIFGNFCYSGWKKPGVAYLTGYGNVNVREPIQTAFTNKNPISYYSYAFDDGTSAPVNNKFAMRMEDSLIAALANDDDSTGNAHLDPNEERYHMLTNGKDFYFNQNGPKDYSYESCVEEFTDPRDGQKYKAICIGDQNWMAQNLNYNYPGSVTYGGDPANGAIYGRLYSFAMLDSICPKGWHVPTDQDFTKLDFAIGDPSGGRMKSMSTLWNAPNLGATNASGFSALPGGFVVDVHDPVNMSTNLGNSAIFATKSVDQGIWENYGLLYDSESLDIFQAGSFDEGVSCRCVKNK